MNRVPFISILTSFLFYSSAIEFSSNLIQRELIDEIKRLAGPQRSSRGSIDCIITGLPNVGKVRTF